MKGDETKDNETRENELRENETGKKPYEAPTFHRHEPLESVSTTYYYYTYV